MPIGSQRNKNVFSGDYNKKRDWVWVIFDLRVQATEKKSWTNGF